MNCINCGGPVPIVRWRGTWRGKRRQEKLTGKIAGWKHSAFTCTNKCALAIRRMYPRIPWEAR